MPDLTAAEEAAIQQLFDRVEKLVGLGKLDEAENFLAEIEKYKPADPHIWFHRGTILTKRGDHEEALALFLKTHYALPDFAANINNIAATQFVLKNYGEAVRFYHKYLELKPDADFVNAALAISLYYFGKLDESIVYFKKALQITPDLAGMHSNLLLAMIYAETTTPENLLEEAEAFGRLMHQLYPANIALPNTKEKNRRLRIGYISPDFRDHPIPYFVSPLLRDHDRTKFEVLVYSTTLKDNPVMERMVPLADVWRDMRTLTPDEAYDKIVSDQVDILVDLSGHTGYNNLNIFARRAAPVQVTWLGYPATTGLRTMDYRITDIYAEPEGMTEHLNTETLMRLPHIFCVYQPHDDSPPVIGHPPFEDNDHITFGCFNNFNKVRDPVLGAWGRILELVPDARLILEIDYIEQDDVRATVLERLKKQGMPIERVTLEPRSKANQFVLYNKVDIALDPFPCVGGTTSMDALWMGVPFVTLAGRHFISRMGVTILTNTGLPELITQSVDEYVATVVDLARDREKLKRLRHNLRERFAASPVMNHQAFAREMEDAFIGMWHRYCEAGD